MMVIAANAITMLIFYWVVIPQNRVRLGCVWECIYSLDWIYNRTE